MAENPEPEDERDSRLPALIGLIVVAVLVVIGYLLTMALRQSGDLQDCLMSGRKNCAPIEAPSTSR
jgi:hypothetical protein